MITFVRTLVITGLALGLSACVTLIPETKPAQLYRFGGGVAEASSAARTEGSVGVVLSGSSFPRASSGDQILTLTGSQAAYVAGARWVAPASILFDEALAQAFDRNTGPARLITRSEVRPASSLLRLDVRRFETVYDPGKATAPVVVVRVRATLTARDDRTQVAEEIFEAQVRASDNRVGQIVAAYDAAVGEVLEAVVDWSNREGRPNP